MSIKTDSHFYNGPRRHSNSVAYLRLTQISLVLALVHRVRERRHFPPIQSLQYRLAPSMQSTAFPAGMLSESLNPLYPPAIDPILYRVRSRFPRVSQSEYGYVW